MATTLRPMSLDVAMECKTALDAIDGCICTPEAKAKLEVNRPGRVVPHYPFVPSDHHPDPWGSSPAGVIYVHKKNYKSPSSKKR